MRACQRAELWTERARLAPRSHGRGCDRVAYSAVPGPALALGSAPIVQVAIERYAIHGSVWQNEPNFVREQISEQLNPPQSRSTVFPLACLNDKSGAVPKDAP